MQEPVVISFHGIESSRAIEARVRAKVRKLERFHPNIQACRVSIEVPNARHLKGQLFEVRIDLDVAGKLLVVDRRTGKDQAHTDVYVAIRDAFDAMRRQLQDYVKVRRGNTKLHEEGPSYARILRLFADDGYGFIMTPDGRELYFHEHSVLNDGFRRLEVGEEVRYAEEDGEKGPQASTVVATGRHKGVGEVQAERPSEKSSEDEAVEVAS